MMASDLPALTAYPFLRGFIHMALTDVAIRSAKPGAKPVRLHDGGGLYLEVGPAGGKWWRWKYRWAGKEKRLSLGVYPAVSLRAARDKRDVARKQLAAGVDPSQARKAEKLGQAGAESFEAIAREWHEVLPSMGRESWRSNSAPAREGPFPVAGQASYRRAPRTGAPRRAKADRKSWRCGDGAPGHAELRSGVPIRGGDGSRRAGSHGRPSRGATAAEGAPPRLHHRAEADRCAASSDRGVRGVLRDEVCSAPCAPGLRSSR